jgi:hypothetical protein
VEALFLKNRIFSGGDEIGSEIGRHVEALMQPLRIVRRLPCRDMPDCRV